MDVWSWAWWTDETWQAAGSIALLAIPVMVVILIVIAIILKRTKTPLDYVGGKIVLATICSGMLFVLWGYFAGVSHAAGEWKHFVTERLSSQGYNVVSVYPYTGMVTFSVNGCEVSTHVWTGGTGHVQFDGDATITLDASSIQGAEAPTSICAKK